MSEHRDSLRAAYLHAKECRDACAKALDLLDNEPLGGSGDDDDEPMKFDPNVDSNPQNR